MFTHYELQEYQKHIDRMNLVYADERVLWVLGEYKEKLENYLPCYIHRPTQAFKHFSTCLWAVEEIQSRIIGKSMADCFDEIRRFIELLEDYDGKSPVNKKHFAIAVDMAQHVYETLYEQFIL